MKLRKPRLVIEPRCLAKWGTSGPVSGAISIPIQGCDPRLVLVPALWVERANDSQGKMAACQSIASGVTWTIYSAVKNARGDLVPLKPLPGFEDMVIRGVNPIGADGVPRFGDSAEVSASTPIVLGITLAEIPAVTVNQNLWFSLTVCPSDAVQEHEEDEHNRESYFGLISEVTCMCPGVQVLSRGS